MVMEIVLFQTPRIEAATSDQKSLLANEVTMEGVLSCKVAVVEGKVRQLVHANLGPLLINTEHSELFTL